MIGLCFCFRISIQVAQRLSLSFRAAQPQSCISFRYLFSGQWNIALVDSVIDRAAYDLDIHCAMGAMDRAGKWNIIYVQLRTNRVIGRTQIFQAGIRVFGSKAGSKTHLICEIQIAVHFTEINVTGCPGEDATIAVYSVYITIDEYRVRFRSNVAVLSVKLDLVTDDERIIIFGINSIGCRNKYIAIF